MTADTWSTDVCSALRRPRLFVALSLIWLLCVLHPSKALTEEHFWTDAATGLAIGGFDPVSYFTETAPAAGSADFEHVWRGVAWRFTSEGNLAAFIRDPEIYAPQFGGLAAIALSNGFRAAGNPRIWLVSQGRLYLFYSRENKKRWAEAAEGFRDRAAEEWGKSAQ